MTIASYIIDIIDTIFQNRSVKVSRDEIRYVLCSTPSFPSIKAVHDTLAYFGLNSNVYQAEYEHIKDKPHSIVHTNKDGGHFFYLKDISEKEICLYDGKNITISKDDFIRIWDGIVLLIEGEKTSYKSFISNNRKGLYLMPLVALLLSGVLMLWNSFETVFQFILDAIGLSISYMLFNQSLFEYQELPLCHWGKHFDCVAVSKANPVKSIIPFNLPVVGLVFFIFDWMLLLLGNFQHIYVLYIYWFAVVCMLLLVIYQLLKIKKYCFYCLCISIVIIIKPFFLYVDSENSEKVLYSIMVALAISVVITSIIYTKGNTTKNNINNTLKLLTMKRIPFLFKKLLYKNPIVNIAKNHAMVFGKENAIMTFDIVINLNCQHCRKVINEICSLIEMWPTLFCWRIYIDGLLSKDINKMENKKQLYVINEYLKSPYKALRVLKEWDFTKGDFEIMPQAWNQYINLVADIKEAGIESYPTVLLNNHLFPTEYEISDMRILLHDWAQGGESHLNQ